jgi:hypothetical protein
MAESCVEKSSLLLNGVSFDIGLGEDQNDKCLAGTLFIENSELSFCGNTDLLWISHQNAASLRGVKGGSKISFT